MATKKVKFTQGASVKLTANFIDHDTGKPINLAGFAGATAWFPPQSGTEWPAVTGSCPSEDLGSTEFTLDQIFTALVNAATDQDIEFEVHHGSGGLETIVEIRTGILDVKARERVLA